MVSMMVVQYKLIGTVQVSLIIEEASNGLAMKLLLFIVSSIVFFTADCRTFPDGPHFAPNGLKGPDFAHDGPEGPKFALNGPKGSKFVYEAQQLKKATDGAPDRDSSTKHKKVKTIWAPGRDSPEEHQQLMKDTLSMTGIQGLDIEMEEGQTESELRESKCQGKPRFECSVRNGYCVYKATPCKGTRVPGGCRSRSCSCCIPECPFKDGFFSPPGSKQCFKLFGDYWGNWTQAMATCQAQPRGLVLAHPRDAVGLRSYMIQRFGPWINVFLNARGASSVYDNGWVITWQDTRPKIPIFQLNPLWYPGQPSNATPSYCLTLYGNPYAWNNSLTKPYAVTPCEHVYYSTLCELVLDWF